MPEQKKPRTFQFHHERLRIDDSEHLLPAANVLLANGFAVWHERVARKGEITGVDLSEDFVCYCRLSDFEGEARMRVRMTDAELTCALKNPKTNEPCIRAQYHEGFCCDVNGSMFWDGRPYTRCDQPNRNSGKSCILSTDHVGYCFDGGNFFVNAKRNCDKGIEQPEVYYELLGHLMAELNIPGALTFWEAVQYLKKRGLRPNRVVDYPNEAVTKVCGKLHPVDRFARCSLPANHDGDHKTSDGQGWPRATETTCGQTHPIEDIGGKCVLARDHKGFHKTAENQGWFSAEGRDISYRCDSPHCPGYSWPHNRAPHPINTCPLKENEPSKETP